MFLNIFIQNGLYIPFIFMFHYLYYKNLFLSTIICLKLYPANYFFWFNHKYKYNNVPMCLNWIKQFIRFTDSGHIINFIYYFYPNFGPIGFNIHFIITSGYWIGRLFFNMKDCDSLHEPIIIKKVEYFCCYCNHSVPLLLFLYEIYKGENIFIFDMKSLYYSYVWGYGWFIFVYMPWRNITQDYVYDLLHPNVSLQTKFMFISLLTIFIGISNSIGYYLTN